jgi:hypothetical protein
MKLVMVILVVSEAFVKLATRSTVEGTLRRLTALSLKANVLYSFGNLA